MDKILLIILAILISYIFLKKIYPIEFPENFFTFKKSYNNWRHLNSQFNFKLKFSYLIINFLLILAEKDSELTLFFGLLFNLFFLIILYKMEMKKNKRLKPGRKKKPTLHEIVALQELLLHDFYPQTKIEYNYNNSTEYYREVAKYHIFNETTYKNNYKKFSYEKLDILLSEKRDLIQSILLNKTFLKKYPKVASKLKSI